MVVFALKQMKLNKYWGVMTGIPIILFSMVIGLRYNVGMDYMTSVSYTHLTLPTIRLV